MGVNCTGWAAEVRARVSLRGRAEWRVAEGRSAGRIRGVKPGLGYA